MPKVSVIVAVYNVEQYIERCARSLFEQTLDDIEYIFVNDCTPDNSMAVLKATLSNYPHRQSQVTIINNQENLKQASTRTIGMKAALGEYLIHCDPDDYVDTDMYETMYRKAVETNADIVTCGWIMHNGNNNANYSIRELKSTGKASLKSLEFSISLCDKLIRTRLIRDNKIYPYPDINFGEDMNVTVRALFYADKVVTLTDYYPYHYISTPDSTTKMPGVEIFERYYSKCAERLVEFLTENGGEEYSVVCNYLKFYCKSPLLNSNKTRQWRETWTECHADIDKYPLPESYKKRMAWMAKHPLILAIYNRYFLMRYKWHQI